jgi:hypothetical protein
MIRSIYFGYRYDDLTRIEDIANLGKIGVHCDFYLAQPNRKTGTLEAIPL